MELQLYSAEIYNIFIINFILLIINLLYNVFHVFFLEKN